jgi:hypothetical protein
MSAKVGIDDKVRIHGYGYTSALKAKAPTLEAFEAQTRAPARPGRSSCEPSALSSSDSFTSSAPATPPKPQLHEAALHGLAGRVVETFDPMTEASLVAMLASFLIAYGNAVGRGPHFYVSETRHGINLFVVIVGATARSRKGTSYGPTHRLFEQVDPDWLHDRRFGGVGSGEGIIWAIRDQSDSHDGVDDKRLFIHEEELSSLLKVMSRSGSIVSEIARKAWDGSSPLRNMVKRYPVQASNPHISLLGHITQEELTRELNATEQANGFGNRNLWIYAERSKQLPDAPRLDDVAARKLATELRPALTFARKTGRMQRDAAATALWHDVYPDLTRDAPGLFGSLTARSEAQVLRLSMVYALLDCSAEIQPVHLTAALALWNYSEDSVRYIFGERLGDPIADRLLDALRTSGELTETELHNLFKRNQRAERIHQALQLLQSTGLAVVEEHPSGGRPTRVWKAVR